MHTFTSTFNIYPSILVKKTKKHKTSKLCKNVKSITHMMTHNANDHTLGYSLKPKEMGKIIYCSLAITVISPGLTETKNGISTPFTFK